MRGIRVGFTGNEPHELYGFSRTKKDRYQALAKVICDTLNSIDDNIAPVVEVNTGGEQGADQLAFSVCDRLRKIGKMNMSLNVFLTDDEQDAPWSDSGLFNQSSFRRQLSKADSIVNTRETVFNGEKRVIWNNILKARGSLIVDNSDMLIAVIHPDDLESSYSWARKTVDVARHRGVPIVVIDPESFKVYCLDKGEKAHD